MGLFRRIFGRKGKSYYTGSGECVESPNIDDRCPKCKGQRIDYMLLYKDLIYETDFGDYVKRHYTVTCRATCMDCGYEWQCYGDYNEDVRKEDLQQTEPDESEERPEEQMEEEESLELEQASQEDQLEEELEEEVEESEEPEDEE